MRAINFLDRSPSGRFIWQESYKTGGLRTVSGASLKIALLDLGLRALGFPRSVTEVTGFLAEANIPSTVFAGVISAGSTVEALVSHGREAGPVIQHRNLSHQHGTVVQGWSLITTLIFGNDEQRAEMAEMMTSEEARRGDYGFAVKVGRIAHDSILEALEGAAKKTAPVARTMARFRYPGPW